MSNQSKKEEKELTPEKQTAEKAQVEEPGLDQVNLSRQKSLHGG